MILDQSLTTIHSSSIVSTDLINHIQIMISWYTHYSHLYQINNGNINSSNNVSTPSYLNNNNNSNSNSNSNNNSTINGINTPPTN